MVIKKYIAQTEDLATQMAQNELGKDVVIMNVKKTTPKGPHLSCFANLM